jgi:hypothetical protein
MTYLTDPSDKNDENLYVYARGTIEEGDTDRFRLFLAGLPRWKGKVIVTFTSSGGLVNEALALAALIESRHYVTTAMGDQCSSACVLAWAAGAQKFVVAHTCIGVHNAAVTGIAKKSLAAAEDKETLVGSPRTGRRTTSWSRCSRRRVALCTALRIRISRRGKLQCCHNGTQACPHPRGGGGGPARLTTAPTNGRSRRWRGPSVSSLRRSVLIIIGNRNKPIECGNEKKIIEIKFSSLMVLEITIIIALVLV